MDLNENARIMISMCDLYLVYQTHTHTREHTKTNNYSMPKLPYVGRFSRKPSINQFRLNSDTVLLLYNTCVRVCVSHGPSNRMMGSVEQICYLDTTSIHLNGIAHPQFLKENKIYSRTYCLIYMINCILYSIRWKQFFLWK